jgi:hypothetical protein
VRHQRRTRHDARRGEPDSRRPRGGAHRTEEHLGDDRAQTGAARGRGEGRESSIRRERKAARNEALQLQQQRITLETHITEEVHTRRQELLINARQRLEESLSKVREEVATLKAKVQKAIALRESQVLGVEGVGAGFGLSLGNRLLKEITRAPVPEDEKAS